VQNINQMLGFDKKFSNSVALNETVPKEPSIIVAPPQAKKSAFFKSMNASYAMFSGWAVGQRYKYQVGVDEAFPLSDHAGLKDILAFVNKCNPQFVYTMHGFSQELAEEIQHNLGIYAEPLA